MGYSARYDPDADFDRWYTDATADAVVPFLRDGDTVLELGCATGRMSALLTEAGAVLTGVDRADAYLELARARSLPAATFVNDDIVDFRAGSEFDHVILANVVHEVPDRAALFANAAHHLRADGMLHVTAQNPGSIHRVVGREMGLILDLTEVSERGQQFETLKVMDAESLVELGRFAGLTVVHLAGIMLKPLPNSLMETLPDDLLWGLVAAARHFPDLGAMNYLVFRKSVSMPQTVRSR